MKITRATILWLFIVLLQVLTVLACSKKGKKGPGGKKKKGKKGQEESACRPPRCPGGCKPKYW